MWFFSFACFFSCLLLSKTTIAESTLKKDIFRILIGGRWRQNSAFYTIFLLFAFFSFFSLVHTAQLQQHIFHNFLCSLDILAACGCRCDQQSDCVYTAIAPIVFFCYVFFVHFNFDCLFHGIEHKKEKNRLGPSSTTHENCIFNYLINKYEFRHFSSNLFDVFRLFYRTFPFHLLHSRLHHIGMHRRRHLTKKKKCQSKREKKTMKKYAVHTADTNEWFNTTSEREENSTM